MIAKAEWSILTALPELSVRYCGVVSLFLGCCGLLWQEED